MRVYLVPSTVAPAIRPCWANRKAITAFCVAVLAASADDLAAVPGMSKAAAQSVRAYAEAKKIEKK